MALIEAMQKADDGNFPHAAYETKNTAELGCWSMATLRKCQK